MKLAAETGAFIAKGTAEGHLVVKLTWSPSTPGAAAAAGAPAAPEAGTTS